MVYKMRIYVDGGCRRNGLERVIGAAVAVFKLYSGARIVYTRPLPDYPPPANQRAEITAVILDLQKALRRNDKLRRRPRLDVKIYSDSRYAVECMDECIWKWWRNGWRNARGRQVQNRRLIEKASRLGDRWRRLGDVEYIWISREENPDADSYCNERLDEEDLKV